MITFFDVAVFDVSYFSHSGLRARKTVKETKPTKRERGDVGVGVWKRERERKKGKRIIKNVFEFENEVEDDVETN
jgi:hypothetical protein